MADAAGGDAERPHGLVEEEGGEGGDGDLDEGAGVEGDDLRVEGAAPVVDGDAVEDEDEDQVEGEEARVVQAGRVLASLAERMRVVADAPAARAPRARRVVRLVELRPAAVEAGARRHRRDGDVAADVGVGRGGGEDVRGEEERPEEDGGGGHCCYKPMHFLGSSVRYQTT